MPTPRLDGDATDEEQNAALAEVLERALQAAQESVERGPELLPVLREHGVVDAGGYGMTLLVAGAIAALRGAEADLPEVAHQAVDAGAHEDVHEVEPLPLTAPTSSCSAPTCRPGAPTCPTLGGAGRLGAGRR